MIVVAAVFVISNKDDRILPEGAVPYSILTLDVYAQALTPAKRAAHLKLVGLIQPTAETAIGPVWSHAEDTVAVSS